MLIRIIVLLMFACTLSACGFHLRGSGGSAALPASLQTMQLSSADPGNGVMRAVRNQLRRSDVTLTEDPNVPELVISTEQVQERIVSLDSNVRAGEYAITLKVEFQLRSGGSVTLGPESLELEKVYLADSNNAAAKTDEARLILNEMRNDLASSIIRQLQRYSP